MQSLGEILNSVPLPQKNNAFSESPQPIKCVECGEVIAAKLYDFGFCEKWIYPTCECRIRKYEELKAEREWQNRQREISIMCSNSNLGSRYSKCTFENFKKEKGTELGLSKAKEFVSNFKPGSGQGLLMIGGTGAGKTHLAVAALQELIGRGFPSVFTVVPELLDRIKATYGRGSDEREDQIIRAMYKADLVVLDDLGAEQLTDWTMTKLYTIINGLYARNTSVIVTTNSTLPVMERRLTVDGNSRVYSRIIEMTDGALFTAKDYRLKKIK